MDVIKAIKERRSIRSFLDKPIEEGHVSILKEALLWAPSAGNLQSRRFYFIYNKDLKRQMSEAAFEQTFIEEAPLLVVACADLNIGRRYGERGRSLYAVQDVSVSLENLMLTAHSLGLGSVWVGAFDESKVSTALKLDTSLKPVAMVPIGHPAEIPEPPDRIPTDIAIIDIE